MRPLLRWAFVLSIIVVCAAVSVPLAAQDDTAPPISIGRHRSARFSLRGTVRDATNSHSVEGVKVDLRQSSGPTVATAFTDGSGEFNFNNLASGAYEIVVNETGYDPIDQQVTVEDSTLGLEIWLRKPGGPRGESGGPVVSVRELSIPRKAHELMQKGLMLLYANSDYRGSIAQFERAIKEYPGITRLTRRSAWRIWNSEIRRAPKRRCESPLTQAISTMPMRTSFWLIYTSAQNALPTPSQWPAREPK